MAFVRAIKIKELAKVVLEDEIVGAKPILLAETGGTNIASTFLRYRDVNYLSILNSNEMEPERIRKAILGGVRYGKPVVFDMDDANLFDQLEVFINRVLPDLFQHILDWSILDSSVFTKLIKDTDEADYQFTGINTTYYDMSSKNFRFIIYIRKEPNRIESAKYNFVTVSN